MCDDELSVEEGLSAAPWIPLLEGSGITFSCAVDFTGSEVRLTDIITVYTSQETFDCQEESRTISFISEWKKILWESMKLTAGAQALGINLQ